VVVLGTTRSIGVGTIAGISAATGLVAMLAGVALFAGNRKRRRHVEELFAPPSQRSGIFDRQPESERNFGGYVNNVGFRNIVEDLSHSLSSGADASSLSESENELREVLGRAIVGGDWKNANSTARKLANTDSTIASKSVTPSVSTQMSYQTHSESGGRTIDWEQYQELDRLIADDDWDGVLVATAKYEKEAAAWYDNQSHTGISTHGSISTGTGGDSTARWSTGRSESSVSTKEPQLLPVLGEDGSDGSSDTSESIEDHHDSAIDPSNSMFSVASMWDDPIAIPRGTTLDSVANRPISDLGSSMGSQMGETWDGVEPNAGDRNIFSAITSRVLESLDKKNKRPEIQADVEGMVRRELECRPKGAFSTASTNDDFIDNFHDSPVVSPVVSDGSVPGGKAPSVASSSGRSSIFSTISTLLMDSPEKVQRRAEIKFQVDELVRRVLPDELVYVDEMMRQFRGREDELLNNLRSMEARKRSVAQLQREEMRRNAKKQARKSVKIKSDLGRSLHEQPAKKSSAMRGRFGLPPASPTTGGKKNAGPNATVFVGTGVGDATPHIQQVEEGNSKSTSMRQLTESLKEDLLSPVTSRIPTTKTLKVFSKPPPDDHTKPERTIEQHTEPSPGDRTKVPTIQLQTEKSKNSLVSKVSTESSKVSEESTRPPLILKHQFTTSTNSKAISGEQRPGLSFATDTEGEITNSNISLMTEASDYSFQRPSIPTRSSDSHTLQYQSTASIGIEEETKKEITDSNSESSDDLRYSPLLRDTQSSDPKKLQHQSTLPLGKNTTESTNASSNDFIEIDCAIEEGDWDAVAAAAIKIRERSTSSVAHIPDFSNLPNTLSSKPIATSYNDRASELDELIEKADWKSVVEQAESFSNLDRKALSRCASRGESSASGDSWGAENKTDLKTRFRVNSPNITPEHNSLRKISVRRSITDGLTNSDSVELLSLPWQNRYQVVPYDSENAIISILIPYKADERGMIKHHPKYRLEQILWSCDLHEISIEQALSLRRLHIINLNPHVKDMSKLGLGKNADILKTSNLFKSAVMRYLRLCEVPFKTQEDHKQMSFESLEVGEVMSLTPDFVLTSPVRFITYQPESEDSGYGEHGQTNWIETKMLYGASSIPEGSDNEIGSILSTAKKYIEIYGPGAYVFAYGCGSKLKSELRDLGVSVLDSHPLDLSRMENYQKGWCGKGSSILP